MRSGERSAAGVLEDCLDEISAQNPGLNAFVHVDESGALAAAKAIDRQIRQGQDPGPFAGVPFGIKDTHDVAGMPTTFGSLFYKNSLPAERDATYVARLRAAGGIPLGKTATAEFGLDSATNTKAWDVTRNPWNQALTPGGSSGGSAAAVAAGMVPFCTAGDGGGSIRSPASFSGLLGLKPSLGLIPNSNGFDSMTCMGALTSNVRDMARFLDAASGPDHRDRTSFAHNGNSFEREIEDLSLVGLKAAWSADLGYALVDPEVIEVAQKTALDLISNTELQLLKREVTLPNCFENWARFVVEQAIGQLESLGFLPDRKDELSDTSRFVLESYGDNSRRQVAQNLNALRDLEKMMAMLLDEVDIIMTPIIGCLPYGAADPLPESIAGQATNGQGVELLGMIANVCGIPAISVPAGFSASGSPIGLQIMSARHNDDLLLKLARLIEIAHPWPRVAPKQLD